ncbi:helix-turn-helix domain-containing protein [Spirosoma foliorum]|uniref:Helix-turn-helix transcriptional regulator n=1 Tax=Spirosoma foliorum TaxID=2710596 RepID=A0A7G5H2P7_9BACT|nr:helix-turn-helix transcriptional regulator [Spirosoma foliorum]QMW05389.1 helix-turn-helix transcriptional regulator [Spirosoma foliorum]
MQPIKERLKAKILPYYYDVEKEEMKKGIGDFSKKVGIGVQSLRDLASGRSTLTLDQLLSFSRAFPGDFDELLEEAFSIHPSSNSKETTQSSVDQEDWKALFYNERAERIQLSRLNEKLTLEVLERQGKMQDNDDSPVKLGASSWSTVKDVIRKQEQDFIAAEADRQTIGYKPSYLEKRNEGKVLPMYVYTNSVRALHY